MNKKDFLKIINLYSPTPLAKLNHKKSMPAPDYSVSYQPTPLVEIKRELEEKAEHDIVSSILEESAKDETTVVSTVRTKEHDKKKESSKGQ